MPTTWVSHCVWGAGQGWIGQSSAGGGEAGQGGAGRARAGSVFITPPQLPHPTYPFPCHRHVQHAAALLLTLPLNPCSSCPSSCSWPCTSLYAGVLWELERLGVLRSGGGTLMAGASAGSLAIATYACGISREDTLAAMRSFAADCRAAGTRGRLTGLLREFLHSYLVGGQQLRATRSIGPLRHGSCDTIPVRSRGVAFLFCWGNRGAIGRWRVQGTRCVRTTLASCAKGFRRAGQVCCPSTAVAPFALA